MRQNGKLHCDICGDIIPQGTIYQIRTLASNGSPGFTATSDADLLPTWTTLEDGSIRLEICTVCSLAMGRPSTSSSKIH